MSLSLVAASSQYAEISSALVSATSHTFAAWVKASSLSATRTIMAIATSGSANHYVRLEIATSNVVRYRFRDTGSSDALSSNALSSTSTWYLVVGRSTSTTSRAANLDNNKGTNASTRNPTGMNRTSIGRSGESSGTQYFDGKIALATIWDVPLSDADVASLVAGAYPTTIESANIVAHYPFKTGALGVDEVNGHDLTVVGATYSSDEPAIDAAPGGEPDPVTGELDATLDDLTFAGSASVSVSGSITGAIEDLAFSGDASVSISGALTGAIEDITFSGTAATTEGVAGTLAATLDDITFSGGASVAVSGELAGALEDITFSGSASVVGEAAPVTGTLNAVLEDIFGTIFASVPVVEPPRFGGGVIYDRDLPEWKEPKKKDRTKKRKAKAAKKKLEQLEEKLERIQEKHEDLQPIPPRQPVYDLEKLLAQIELLEQQLEAIERQRVQRAEVQRLQAMADAEQASIEEDLILLLQII